MCNWVKKINWLYLSAILMSIVVLGMPYLLTRSCILGKVFTETGQIGDTLGGITAPFIGIFSIVLLVKTLSEQQKFNQKQVEKDDYTLVKAIRDDIIAACKTIEFQYFSEKTNRLEKATSAGALNLLGPLYQGALKISNGAFDKLHQEVLYIASLYSFWCEIVADSSLNFEMANVYQRAINYYVEPVITYLERYQECTIPIYEDTISEEDTIFDDGPISDESKHQAQMICDKVDASLNKLKKLKPLK